MVANERLKWKNSGLKLAKLVSKEKEIDDINNESASS